MNKRVEEALNSHLNLEFNSAYLYLSMSAYIETLNLPGFAHWMYIQYQEENQHAVKFFQYINDREGRVDLESIEKPISKWDSLVQVFEYSLSHEKKVSEEICKLVGLAHNENDFMTHNFLQWFVSEQMEEEKTFSTLLEKIKRVEKSPEGLYLLDKDLSTRVLATNTNN